MIQPSENISEIKSRLQKLFPDSKIDDRPMGTTLLISWEPIFRPSEPSINKVFQKILKQQTSTACFRCGRTSHWVQDCFASTDVHGNELD